jgi:hypothetical protein
MLLSLSFRPAHENKEELSQGQQYCPGAYSFLHSNYTSVKRPSYKPLLVLT